MQVIGLKSRIVEVGDSLVAVFKEALRNAGEHLQSDDVVVISSKVVAICEGRVVNLDDVEPSETAKQLAKETYDRTEIEDPRFTELVLREADNVLPGPLHLTINEKILIPAAGIDRSNIPEGKVVLWPENLQQSADTIRAELMSSDLIAGEAFSSGVSGDGVFGEGVSGEVSSKVDQQSPSKQNLGIIVADSHCQPMRKGVIGIALSWSGFEGVEDVRGEPDLYGKKLQVTQKAVADNLACAASVVMGEGNDCIPFVIVRGAKVLFTEEQQNCHDNFFPPKTCIFSGIYSNKFKNIVENDV